MLSRKVWPWFLQKEALVHSKLITAYVRSGRTQHCHHAQAEAESWPSIAELEQEGVSELLQSEAAGQLQQRYTFLYARAPDLRMDDVPVLLRQYKELILKHEAMVCAFEAHRAKQQSGAAATQGPSTAGTAGLHAIDWLLHLIAQERQLSQCCCLSSRTTQTLNSSFHHLFT